MFTLDHTLDSELDIFEPLCSFWEKVLALKWDIPVNKLTTYYREKYKPALPTPTLLAPDARKLTFMA